jgi:hypothetical protein
MRFRSLLPTLCAALFLLAPGVAAQTAPTADREIAWRTYSSERAARVRVYETDDARRPTAVVLDDRAANGSPITDEAAFVADLAAREFGFDPTEATFVFRFTPAAFDADADARGKTLLLRVTFSRGASGALASPQWRVLTEDGLDRLLDRASL